MLRKFILILVLADNWLTNLFKRIFPTQWRLAGRCRQCGQCCRRIILTMTPAQLRSKLFTDLSVRWLSWLFRFELTEVDREHHSLVFRCRQLTAANKCGDYRWRPNICRNYPLVDYFNEPRLLPGCGFSAEEVK